MLQMSKPIADTILLMAAERGPLKTICPSDVAREMFPQDWRKHMDDVRLEAIVLQPSYPPGIFLTNSRFALTNNHLNSLKLY